MLTRTSGLPDYLRDALNPPAPPAADPLSVGEAVAASLASAPWWAWPTAALVLLVGSVGALWLGVTRTRQVLSARRARLEERAHGDVTAQARLSRVRGQVTMDRLIAVQFLVAMGFSAFGMSQVAHESAGIPVPANWLLFVVFEGFALTLMVMIDQRATAGLPYPGLLVGYWVTITVAAGFNATHGDGLTGSLVWAAITLMAGFSYALRMGSKRADQEQKLKEAAGKWTNRRLTLVRLLHPVEYVRVLLEMASHEELSAEEATARVRDRAAAARRRRMVGRVRTAVWELRRAQAMPWPDSERGKRKAEARLVRLESAAQEAIAAAELATDTSTVATVLRELQMMDLAGEFASMSYTDVAPARRAMQRLITEESLAPLAIESGAVAVQAPAPAPVVEAEKAAPEPRPSNVTPMKPRIPDAELETRAREVYSPGMSLNAFRQALGVGMKKAHPLHQMLRAESEATG